MNKHLRAAGPMAVSAILGHVGLTDMRVIMKEESSLQQCYESWSPWLPFHTEEQLTAVIT